MSASAAAPALAAQRRHQHAWLAVGAGLVVLLAAVIVSLGVGAVRIAPARVIAILAAELGLEPGALAGLESTSLARDRAVVVAIRLPRVLGGLLVGSSLAVCGAALQGLFRNPLAGPSLVGVSSGAALAAAATIVLGGGASAWLLPAGAFAGGLAAVTLVYLLATRDRRTDVATLLLAGIAINALAGAGNGVFTFLATDAQLRDITFWSLGSLGGITWRTLTVSGPVMALAVATLPRLSRELNALLLGEREAAHIGTNVQLVKIVTVAVVAAGVGASVSISGVIGFIGLVAPHLVRLLVGPDYRTLLPGSAVMGGLLLLLADLAARTVVAPAELPIGIVTALVGGPFFVWLLLRHRGRRLAHA